MSNRLSTTVPLVVAALVIASTPGFAAVFPVEASVPAKAKLRDFLDRKLAGTVTCAQACTASTAIVIRAAVAKRLGFSHVTGKTKVIATNENSESE